VKPLSECTVAVIDHGLFSHVARRLARDCKLVYYWTPWERSFPLVREGNIGGGFSDIERIDDFWPIKTEVDFWVFPDVGFSGLQAELKSQGCKVWGAGAGDALEIFRGNFLKTLASTNLQVPPYTVIKGMENLRVFLKDKTDKWIKISRWRGDWETMHWRDWPQDEQTLVFKANQIGPVADDITYYVFDPIETEIEDGSDAYFCGGTFPSRVIHGMEAKDKAFLGTFCDFNDLPKPVLDTNEAMAAILKEYGYNGFFSTEVRIKTPDDFYFTDPTCRAGSPPSQVMTEMLQNYSEIIQSGAHGECIEPVEASQFGMQLLVKIKRSPAQWGNIIIPDELDQWFKPSLCMKTKSGVIAFPPDEENVAGWIVAIGDTIEETLDTLKQWLELLPDGLESDIAPMAALLEEVKTAEEQNMEFTDQPVPEPTEVMS
jgi:predicted RNase H-like HicB family nuclease